MPAEIGCEVICALCWVRWFETCAAATKKDHARVRSDLNTIAPFFVQRIRVLFCTTLYIFIHTVPYACTHTATDRDCSQASHLVRVSPRVPAEPRRSHTGRRVHHQKTKSRARHQDRLCAHVPQRFCHEPIGVCYATPILHMATYALPGSYFLYIYNYLWHYTEQKN